MRRVRPLGSDAQGKLFETWQHHALISNRTDALAVVEAEHRAHAVVELAIRDVKDQALAHFPSVHFAPRRLDVIPSLPHLLLTKCSALPPAPQRAGRIGAVCSRSPAASPPRPTITLHLPAPCPWQTATPRAHTHPGATISPTALPAALPDHQARRPGRPRAQTCPKIATHPNIRRARASRNASHHPSHATGRTTTPIASPCRKRRGPRNGGLA